MHRRYRYDVTELLTGHGHRLAVHLESAYTYAEAEQARLGKRPNAYPEPFNYVRKMACSFGWDWGPTIAGAGIWRPARLEAWSGPGSPPSGRWWTSSTGPAGSPR